VLGTEFGGQVQSMFDADLLRSVRVQPGDWEVRAWTAHIKEFVARLWEYWL